MAQLIVKALLPFNRLDWDLLVNEFTSLLKNEMTTLGLSPFPGAQRSNEDSLAIRQKGIRQLVLREVGFRGLSFKDNAHICTFVCHLVCAVGASALKQYTSKSNELKSGKLSRKPQAWLVHPAMGKG